MKKNYFIFVILGFSFSLFCQNLQFDDVTAQYEKILTTTDLQNLRNFSTSLDLYIQSTEYKRLSKHSDFQTAFLDLNKTTKKVLGAFNNPWTPGRNDEFFNTTLINEKFYYFLLIHDNYITQRKIFYRLFISIFGILNIFVIVLLIVILNHRKEKFEGIMLTKAMLSGQEMERKRISEEIHDTIAQNLKVQKLQILNIITKNKDKLNISSDLEEVLEKSKSNITEIRSICQNLFPPNFETQKLDWIIAELCENIKKNTNILCTYLVDSENSFEKMDQENKLNIFRIIQEAVNNAVTHSECTIIQIFITKKELIISDNGKGFDYEKEISTKQNHFGLRSIKERALLLDSTLEVKSNNKGTTISLKL